MPDGLSALVGHIVNALAMCGVAAIAFLVGKTVRSKTALKPAQSPLQQKMREHITERAKIEQEAIQDALDHDDAAQRLAELGNERRR